jgi:putative transposase
LDGQGRTQRSAPTDVGIAEGVHNNNWHPFYKRLWQRGYYENIIRNENDLNRIREYIINNPTTWHLHKNVNDFENR